MQSLRSGRHQIRATRMCPASGEISTIPLEDLPGLFTVLLAPLRVEACGLKSLLERLLVHGVEDQSLLFELGLQSGVELGHVLALRHSTRVEQTCRGVAKVLGKLFPIPAVRHHPEAFPHMPGERAVLLHLVEFRGFDQGKRIFLAVYELRLKCRVDLDEVDRSGSCSECAEHRCKEWAHGDTQLEPLKVARLVDRLVAGRDLAEAVVPHLVKGDQAESADLLADISAEIAINGRPNTVEIGKRKGNAADGRGRNEVGQRRSHGEDIERAGPHLAQHIRAAAELAVRENLYVDPSVGGGTDGIARLRSAFVNRMRCRQVVAVLQIEFARPRALANNARSSQRARAGQHGSPRNPVHGIPPTSCRFDFGYYANASDVRWRSQVFLPA